MTLRRRLAWVTALVALPQIALLLAWDKRSRRAAATSGLALLMANYLDADDAALCQRDPAAFGGVTRPPGPPPGELVTDPRPDRPHGAAPILSSFTRDGAPARPDGGAPPEGLDGLRLGEISALPTPWLGETLRVGTRTGWGGACELVVLEGTTVAGWIGAVLPASPLWLAPLAGSVLGILLAAGSVVERIRALTAAVRRSAAEGAPARLPTEGDDEVAELALAFEQAGRALQAQIAETARREAALREFLANTSHDVMLPLTVLRGHLSALRDQADEGALDRAAVAHAMDEAHYLGALLQNLSAVARLEASDRAPELHPVDLVALVDRVAARHRGLSRERGVELVSAVPGAPARAICDVTLIEQALNNLAFNAVRYNHAGGHVAVLLELSGPSFTLRVLDDGGGVSDEALARMVERGFRADEARSRAPEGLGLGLSIAARVAELHGFTLSFQRADQGGLDARISGPIHIE